MDGLELSAGLAIKDLDNLNELIEFSQRNGFNYCASNILRDCTKVLNSNDELPLALENEMLIVDNANYALNVAGIISVWPELDSSDLRLRQRTELMVKKEVEWAAHLGLASIVFQLPERQNIVNFSRIVAWALDFLVYTSVFVKVKPKDWTNFNILRMVCSHHVGLGVILEIPDTNVDEKVLYLWVSEPSTQKIIIQAESIQLYHSLGGFSGFREYLCHLFDTKPGESVIDEFAQGYHDCLQTPLQPLMDNLESSTYEVFEKDPVKYQEYENAICQALLDRDPSRVWVVMVVGAGRGPLVDRSLKAAERAQRNIRLYAIEKNANAIITLRNRKLNIWKNLVEVIHTDMRYWEAPELCDILVSELLGSFGDNELSPECLDGAQRLLAADGISIPANYTSYIAPLSSVALYNKAVAFGEKKHFEIPYVVKFRDTHELAPSQKLWSFNHPKIHANYPSAHPYFNLHNERYGTATFTITDDTLIHGFSAYFESVLYKDVMISINPVTHSEDMTSWFPIYFPIREPIYLPKDSQVECHFWRLTDNRKVWYEWCAIPIIGGVKIVSLSSEIHNKGGHSSYYNL